MDQYSILYTTRTAIGLEPEDSAFDEEIKAHINTTLAILKQNGIGRGIVVTDESQTWEDFKDPLQIDGNEYFYMVPLYVFTKTKLVFDPPPPSNVAYYKDYTAEILWRLRAAYDVSEQG